MPLMDWQDGFKHRASGERGERISSPKDLCAAKDCSPVPWIVDVVEHDSESAQAVVDEPLQLGDPCGQEHHCYYQGRAFLQTPLPLLLFR
jgi:hypothetical protein